MSQTSEYALRAMVFLASTRGEAVPVADLARETQVPRSYLSKVMRRLVLAGLVHSQRGHGGGFALARAPARIRFADVLEAVDAPLDEDRCAFGLGRCKPDAPCSLHGAWSEISEQFRDWARRTTLADGGEIPAGNSQG